MYLCVLPEGCSPTGLCGSRGGAVLTSQASSFSGVMVFPLSKWSSWTISAEDRDRIHIHPAHIPLCHPPATTRPPTSGIPRGLSCMLGASYRRQKFRSQH